jgi:hypothetical protein
MSEDKTPMGTCTKCQQEFSLKQEKAPFEMTGEFELNSGEMSCKDKQRLGLCGKLQQSKPN